MVFTLIHSISYMRTVHCSYGMQVFIPANDLFSSTVQYSTVQYSTVQLYSVHVWCAGPGECQCVVYTGDVQLTTLWWVRSGHSGPIPSVRFNVSLICQFVTGCRSRV